MNGSHGFSIRGLTHKSNQIQLHKYFDKLGLTTFCENGTFNPRKSGSPSGRGTFRNSSTVPIAGRKSGIKGFNIVPISTSCG